MGSGRFFFPGAENRRRNRGAGAFWSTGSERGARLWPELHTKVSYHNMKVLERMVVSHTSQSVSRLSLVQSGSVVGGGNAPSTEAIVRSSRTNASRPFARSVRLSKTHLSPRFISRWRRRRRARRVRRGRRPPGGLPRRGDWRGIPPSPRQPPQGRAACKSRAAAPSSDTLSTRIV